MQMNQTIIKANKSKITKKRMNESVKLKQKKKKKNRSDGTEFWLYNRPFRAYCLNTVNADSLFCGNL